MSVSLGDDGRVLLHCHAGCEASLVCEAMGLRLADLFPPNEKDKTQSRIAAVYDYRDERAELLFQVVRYEPKRFRQRRPDGHGGWIWKLGRTPRVLYRLPELIAADAEEWAFVVEGEKDADRIAAVGLVGTTCPQGAGKWCKLSNDSALHDRRVVTVPDMDAAGRKHAIDVATRLYGNAREIRVLELPGSGKDVSDWFDAGGTADQLNALVEAAPVWAPTTEPSHPPASEATESFEGIMARLVSEPDAFASACLASDVIEVAVSTLRDDPVSFRRGVNSLHEAGIEPEKVHEFRQAVKEQLAAKRRKEREDGSDATIPSASVATRMVETAVARAELFHDTADIDVGYASITHDGRRETYPIESRPFRSWLLRMHYAEASVAPSGDALTTAVGTLSAMARFEGNALPVGTRLAEHGGVIYLNLADADWRVVRIAPDGWSIISSTDCPIRFVRRRGMLPLPAPERNGSINELRPLVNMPDDDAWYLCIAWLLGALRPAGPHPVLVVEGEQGSAKTTLVEFLRDLLDPNKAPTRSEPREVRDLMIAAAGSWILAFDNLSHLPSWLSDALCRIATGAGFGTRQLHTDAEEILFSACRPTILNGIEGPVSRADLLDRAITLTLPTISDEQRKPTKALRAEFNRIRPRVLGALLEGVVCGLRDGGCVALPTLPRMADFAEWAYACATTVGVASTDFLRAYSANRQSATHMALEASPIAAPLVALIESQRTWCGNALSLLTELERDAWSDDRMQRAKEWPRSARKLSSELRRIGPELRRAGIEVVPPDKRDKQRLWSIFKVAERPPTSPTPPTNGPGAPENGDSARAVDADSAHPPNDRPNNRPVPDAPEDSADGLFGRSGGLGGVAGVCGADGSDEPDEPTSDVVQATHADDWGEL